MRISRKVYKYANIWTIKRKRYGTLTTESLNDNSIIKEIGLVPPAYPFKYWAKYSDQISRNIKCRNIMYANIETVNSLYNELVSLKKQEYEIRRQRNITSNSYHGVDDSKDLKFGKDLKIQLENIACEINRIQSRLFQEAAFIPNDTNPKSPVGNQNEEIYNSYSEGTPKPIQGILDHFEIAKRAQLFDIDSGSKTTGSGFFYWTNDGVNLELALVQYAFRKAIQHGFTPIITPDIVQDYYIERCGFHPRGLESNPIYFIKEKRNESKSGLALIGTSEISLASKHSNDQLKQSQLPIQYVAQSHCFRSEATREKRGIYRVHQFTKVELFIISTPDQSDNCFDKIIALQAEILKELGLGFRILNMATSELGASAYKKYDMEVWMPGRNQWGEVCSTSHCTDYQSRRLNIRYRDIENKSILTFPHTLNGTALAVPRIVIGLLEQGQMNDNIIRLPKCLSPWWWGETSEQDQSIPIIRMK